MPSGTTVRLEVQQKLPPYLSVSGGSLELLGSFPTQCRAGLISLGRVRTGFRSPPPSPVWSEGTRFLQVMMEQWPVAAFITKSECD